MLSGGEEIEADLVVTATGLVLQPLGGVRLSVDGAEVDLAKTMTYKGAMFSDVPNLASVFGYTNASWTLKADLICQFVCRLLNHMAARGYRQCTPHNDDRAAARLPLVDFSSGLFQRALDLFPKQGSKSPWRSRQNYARDFLALKFGALGDGALRFSSPAASSRARRDVRAERLGSGGAGRSRGASQPERGEITRQSARPGQILQTRIARRRAEPAAQRVVAQQRRQGLEHLVFVVAAADESGLAVEHGVRARRLPNRRAREPRATPLRRKRCRTPRRIRPTRRTGMANDWLRSKQRGLRLVVGGRAEKFDAVPDAALGCDLLQSREVVARARDEIDNAGKARAQARQHAQDHVDAFPRLEPRQRGDDRRTAGDPPRRAFPAPAPGDLLRVKRRVDHDDFRMRLPDEAAAPNPP